MSAKTIYVELLFAVKLQIKLKTVIYLISITITL